ncbi:hypothetical protein HOP50_16g78000 [Chloropicon primus]|uniref:EF-hand domain-containing protein n=1 Tax=Chloropicon primus TaxID=1764295 RepID=A0A5B8N0H6_9CHLO|nr:hypothetical protein A3770_16p77720 [Chloropicon primus]UPR04459.1 hypothetical protein HOP50_16g78000 [Chloropicon primus]|eukprot:QDZ25254.1 hypothetical protein A3770_16p77720 [Chloropicon primus]
MLGQKSAVNSPRPKLKGSRSTQSVGGASTVSMSTESGMLLRLIDAQRARKIAEEDKKRLNNRVKQLLKEEEKAKKRISETKKRAEEILSLKKRNEIRVQEKEAQRQEMEDHIVVLNKNKTKLKASHAKRKEKAQQDLVRVKKQLSQETREESMQHERALHQQRKLAQRRALETRESIRKSKSEAAAKLAKAKVKHMSNVKEDYMSRLDNELSHLRDTEQELNDMTMLEMELIQRLQEKQREQETAYTKLEQVLGIAQGGQGPGKSPKKKGPSASSSPMRLKRPNTTGTPPQTTPQQQQQQQGSGYEEPTDDEISAKFGLLDKAGTGFISTADLGKLLVSLGLNLNENQVDQARGQLDQGQTGQISFGEFFLWWKG